MLCAGHRTQRTGSTMIEFCLSTALWTAVIMGLATVGMNLIRALQVEQICRDAGGFIARGWISRNRGTRAC